MDAETQNTLVGLVSKLLVLYFLGWFCAKQFGLEKAYLRKTKQPFVWLWGHYRDAIVGFVLGLLAGFALWYQ